MSSSGIAIGLKKGYPITSKVVAPRPASRKGRCGPKTKMVRELIREVVGLMPYEKRILDMIKTGGTSAEKRIYKFSKQRVSYLYMFIYTYVSVNDDDSNIEILVGNASSCITKT